MRPSCHDVTSRRTEIGIRLAIGADARDITGIASPGEPWPIALTFALTALVSLLVLWRPLGRATSIDPLSALRSE